MNNRKHEFNNRVQPGLLHRFIRSSNKTTRKIAFALVVIFLSALIWLAGWLIEFVVVNLFNGALWVITSII